MNSAVHISREKLYPTAGRNYRAAWKWLYTVHADGERYTGEGLGWAKGLAKRKAQGRPVILCWEPA